jgi:hypothetical protein
MLQLLKASRSNPDFYRDTTTLLTRYSSAWQVGLNHSRNKTEQTKTNQKQRKNYQSSGRALHVQNSNPKVDAVEIPSDRTQVQCSKLFLILDFLSGNEKRGASEQPRQAAPSETAGQCPGVGWLAGTHATTVWAASRVQTTPRAMPHHVKAL